MTVHIDVDVSEVREEVRRIGDGPDSFDLLRLEFVFTSLYAQTQEAVHVRTGSLKRSGKPSSHWRNKVFTAEITYGGEAHGAVHDPVKYAQYERDRGDIHDFLRPVYGEVPDARYTEAILAFYRGD